MSKLIAYLEFDTGLKLFDRHKGRLAPTEHAMRLYDEIGRIFAGVRQVENAVEAIRREEQGRLSVGVMPALAGSFIQRATTAFLADRNVFCTVQSLSSEWILDLLVSRKLDVGLVDAGLENPYVITEPLMDQPLVCIMPMEHSLSAKSIIEPKDLDGVPFVSPHPDTYVGRTVTSMFDHHGVSMRVALIANIAPMVCEFVAAGIGVSLVPPLCVSGLEDQLTVRPFEPAIAYNFQLCRSADSRNAHLVDAFVESLRETATTISHAMLQ